MDNYKTCIAKLVEEGYTDDFEEDECTQESKGIWISCEDICKEILSTSVNLIFATPLDIVASLITDFKNLNNEKKKQNASFSLMYITNSNSQLIDTSVEKVSDVSIVTQLIDSCIPYVVEHVH